LLLEAEAAGFRCSPDFCFRAAGDGHAEEFMGDETSQAGQEERLFKLLEEYLQSQETGDGEIAAELRNAFPGLDGMLDCLDALESLATQTLPTPPGAGIDLSAAQDSGSSFTRSSRFGRYDLLRQIGSGGMGVVFEARQVQLDCRVALKLVRSGEFASEEEIARFYAEARAAAGIRHPKIVCVHDVGECQGQHYLTMDLIEGETLADVIRREERLDPRHAAELVATIARAVDYLHGKEIVHRDLKPSNILLDEQGAPYVTDFGLAKAFQHDAMQTLTGTILGTAAYMSPEQASGNAKTVSVQSDVYSLGAILYELLTGAPPFKAENPLDVLLQVLESEPEPPRRRAPGIPAELEEICLACLEKSPDDRLESAARIADELERYLRNESIRLEPRSFWDRLRRWTRREPALASRLAIVAAGAIVVQANYQITQQIAIAEHLRVMLVIAGWALTCAICQHLVNWRWLDDRMPWVWAVTDVAFLTTLLVLARPGESLGPIVIGFPLLVVASGLWFETKLVGLMTVLSVAGYLLVHNLRDEGVGSVPRHYPYIFIVVLCGIGYIVGYQVDRIRTLSRYFNRRC
jgi:eukaryotic-like serine/threonine-protein kinase